MTGITIVPASEDDQEWCARLMASSDPWITLGRHLAACRAAFGHSGYEAFVAHDGGQRLGFVLCHPRGAMGSPYIATIAVAPEARSRGLGRRLLEFTEEHYSGKRHLFLCVSSFNPRARQLYERMGYQAVADLQDYLIAGASEILMHKRLG